MFQSAFNRILSEGASYLKSKNKKNIKDRIDALKAQMIEQQNISDQKIALAERRAMKSESRSIESLHDQGIISNSEYKKIAHRANKMVVGDTDAG